MRNIIFILFVLSVFPGFAQQKRIPPKSIQIATAVLAAPEMYREGAKVLGYAQNGKLTSLREGTNSMICLADNPQVEGISVACYGEDLEAFMARGRELIAEGKSESEKREIRKKEIDAGTLKMPKEPSILYVLSAAQKDYNPNNGELQNSRIRYVLYKPYMTGESTGLPTKPQAPGMPWLMEAGSHRSHIMITPAAN